MSEPCPEWHNRPQAGCHMEDYYLGDGEWDSYEWHCPGCCPDLIDKEGSTDGGAIHRA